MDICITLQELAKPIFNNLYPIRVKMKDSMGVEDIKRFGIPTVMDRRADFEMANDVIDRYIKICDMVEYFKNDTPFWLKNRGDAREIYDIVRDYLTAWIDYLKIAINIGEIPQEDLLSLDTLASRLYPYATEGDDLGQSSVYFGLNVGLVPGGLVNLDKKDIKYGYISPIQEISRLIHSRSLNH